MAARRLFLSRCASMDLGPSIRSAGAARSRRRGLLIVKRRLDTSRWSLLVPADFLQASLNRGIARLFCLADIVGIHMLVLSSLSVDRFATDVPIRADQDCTLRIMQLLTSGMQGDFCFFHQYKPSIVWAKDVGKHKVGC